MSFSLDPVETRILGCLLEKERLTPENYPLSLNALTNACNQSTNREPVVAWDEATVEKGLDRLRVKKLAAMLHAAGSRVPKYRHTLPDQFTLDRAETALLCVLLLRGPQTVGELRQRTERMSPFETLEEVERCLGGLAQGDSPLVELLTARPGQKERRYVQLLSTRTEETPAAQAEVIVPPPEIADPARMAVLENEVQTLRAELQTLREEFAQFRRQFE
jgi:uncharacterized protein YceH (UPF0502 family)